MKKLLFFILFIGLIQPAFAQTAKPIDLELQKLKDNLAAAQHDTARMMALVDIANYYKDVRLQFDSSLVYGLKAEQIANHYPSYFKTPVVFNTLGNIYYDISYNYLNTKLEKKYLDAGQYYKKCLDVARKVKNEEYVERAWYNSLNIIFNNSKYQYFKGSFEFINFIQKKAQLSSLDSLLLRFSYKRICDELDYEMESKKFNTYLALYKSFTPRIGKDYEKYCILNFEQQAVLGKKSDEQNILKQYATYQQAFKMTNYKDELYLYLVKYYFTIQDYNKSFRLSSNLFPQKQKYDKPRMYLTCLGFKYMLMGQSAYMLNRNKEAITYLQKAINFFNPVLKASGMENEKYTAVLYLSKAYKKAGNYKQALACTEQADVLYKQIHDVGRQALMAENDVQLEQIKQDKKVQEAQTQILLKEQETQLEKRQKYMFALFALVALLSTGWAFYNFRKTRRQNAIISQQATALQESNQVKDKIFALLGHDLRAPINRLVMRMNDSGSGQLPDIRHELKNMYDILNNVLYWASMQLKKITPVNRPTELKYLVSSVAEEYQFDLTDKNITFLNAIDKTIEVKTDENYLKIILRNLISNAIKFTNPNGFIKIDCSIKNSIAEIILKDTGIGVPPEKLKTIFNLPTPSIGTHQEKGTGLGLSLSLDIAKKLNGDIQIKSQEGRGTQVILSLRT